ncbi:hypothetical protein EV360DRAFT_87208 [Lentinula raphanica]|nr:hypothetical protein EV360DRAFT_87208 [Lentinula raphanica]
MLFHVTCSLQLASVLLGVISVTASPLPPDSQHSLEKRGKGTPFRIALVIGDDYANLNNKRKDASVAQKQNGDITVGLGLFDWLVYPDIIRNPDGTINSDDTRKPYRKPCPVITKSRTVANKDYFQKSEILLIPSFLSLSPNFLDEGFFPILLDRERLASFMTPEFIAALSEAGFQYDNNMDKGKTCVLATLACLASRNYLLTPQQLRNPEVLKNLISLLDEVKPPLPPNTSAAALPHDRNVPNLRVDGSSPAPQHFAPSTSNPSPVLPEDLKNLHNPHPQADNWKENAASWKPSLGNILYDPTVLEHSRASKPAM